MVTATAIVGTFWYRMTDIFKNPYIFIKFHSLHFVTFITLFWKERNDKFIFVRLTVSCRILIICYGELRNYLPMEFCQIFCGKLWVLIIIICLVLFVLMKVIETLLHRGKKGLGFSIAGGVGSQPYIESDEVFLHFSL